MISRDDLSFFPVYRSMSLDQGNMEEDPTFFISQKIRIIEEQIALVATYNKTHLGRLEKEFTKFIQQQQQPPQSTPSTPKPTINLNVNQNVVS